MMDEDVFCSNRRKDVAAAVSYAFGVPRDVGLEQELRSILYDHLLHVTHANDACGRRSERESI